MSRLRSSLSYANVTATIALFLVLTGGVVYAAGKITSKDIGRGAVKSKHVADDSLNAADIDEAGLEKVAKAAAADRADVAGSAATADRAADADHATTADQAESAASAASATNATNAANAAALGGSPASDFVRGSGASIRSANASYNVISGSLENDDVFQLPGLGDVNIQCRDSGQSEPGGDGFFGIRFQNLSGSAVLATTSMIDGSDSPSLRSESIANGQTGGFAETAGTIAGDRFGGTLLVGTPGGGPKVATIHFAGTVSDTTAPNTGTSCRASLQAVAQG